MKPEIIVKQTFLIDATGDEEYAVPELLLLGNREGFLKLAESLRTIAESIPNPDHAEWDPDDHQHFSTSSGWDEPFNKQLSDELEFRTGIITAANREVVLQKYGISEDSRAEGNLVDRYRAQANEAERSLGSR